MKLVALFTFLLAVAGLARGAAEPPLQPPAPGQVAWWLTTFDGARLLEPQPHLAWSPTRGIPTTVIDPSVRYQSIVGFGGSLCDNGLWSAEPAVRDEGMRMLFSRTTGIGLSVIRIHMDTYSNVPPGETDPELTHFSIASDLEWKLPYARMAKQLNPELLVMASPWSAPVWMKDSGKIGSGRLKPEWYQTYARYLVKWLLAWREHGVDVEVITLQNEPGFEPGWYAGMKMSAQEQIAFAKVIAPELRKAGLATRILAHDHNANEADVVIEMLNDPAAKAIYAGSAFHGYSGWLTAMGKVHAAHPDRVLWFTEATGVLPADGFRGSMDYHLTHFFNEPLRNWSQTVMLWKLDRIVGPDRSGDRPFVGVTPDGKRLIYYGEMYETAHFSRFVRPGAFRVDSTEDAATRTTAFANPDGTMALVLHQKGEARDITVAVGERSVQLHLPAQSVATLYWRDGGSDTAAATAAPPSIPGALSARPATDGVHLAWWPAHGATRYRVTRTDAAGQRTVAETHHTTALDTTPNTGHVEWTVQSLGAGTSQPSVPATLLFADGPLPPAWNLSHLGGSPAGSAGTAGARLILQSHGTNLWGSSDSAIFLHQPMPAQGLIAGRVISQQAKTGLMIRAADSPSAAYAMIAATPGNGIVFQWRSAEGAASASAKTRAATFAPPVWLKLTRDDNRVSGWCSLDNINWRRLGTANVDLGATALGGIAATAGDGKPATYINLSAIDSLTTPRAAIAPGAVTMHAPIPGQGQVHLHWQPATYASHYLIERRQAGGFTRIGQTDQTSFVHKAGNSAQAEYRVIAMNGALASEPSNSVVANARGELPAPWFTTDIGSAKPGAASLVAGQFHLRGNGTLWGKQDACRFVYRAIDGNFRMTVRVRDVQPQGLLAKCGIMVRDGLGASAAMLFVVTTPDGDTYCQHRPQEGASVIGGGRVPRLPGTAWVRLERAGDDFTASASADGETWEQLISLTVPMSQAIQLGLTTSAQHGEAFGEARFDALEISPAE